MSNFRLRGIYRKLCVLVILSAADVNSGHAADEAAVAAPIEGSSAPWWEKKWAAGDWNGERSRLEEKGFVFEFTYTGEVRSNFKGGINTADATEYLANVNASVDFFTDKMGLYEGGEYFIRFENVHGKGISATDVGDVQLLSSIDAQPFNQVSECFYRHSLLDNRLHFKIGKQDGTGDFIALKYGADFTHSSYGCMANVPLPRFHNEALGAVASYDALSWFSFGTGVYDSRSTGKTTGFDTAFGRPFHEFSIFEMSFKPNLTPSLPGVYRFGTWHERRDLAEIGLADPPVPPLRSIKHNFGAYMNFDQLIYKKSEKPEDDRGLGIFGQLSWTPDDRNAGARYFGAGVRYKGIFSGRNEDIVGAGITDLIFSERLKRTEGKTSESAIEAFYKVRATPFMWFQPDFQYIVRPGGNGRDAVTGGMRFQIAF